jgi:hypothetical protein
MTGAEDEEGGWQSEHGSNDWKMETVGGCDKVYANSTINTEAWLYACGKMRNNQIYS